MTEDGDDDIPDESILTPEEMGQKRAAVIAGLSCDIPQDILVKAFNRAKNKLRTKLPNKHDYMLARKRDVKWNKKEKTPEKKFESVEDDIARGYSDVAASIDLPFLRGFEHGLLRQTIADLHP